MSELEEKEWSYEAEKWVDILLNWIEFCRRRGLPSTTTVRKIVVRLPFTSLSDQSVQKVEQLVDLLLQRVPTRCPLEKIQSFEFSFVSRISFVYDDYDRQDNERDECLNSIIRHCCRFVRILPLNITKFRCKSTLYPLQRYERLPRYLLHAQAPILSALSENRHLTELSIDVFSPIVTDHLIPRNPLLETLTVSDSDVTSEQAAFLMRSAFNGKTSRLRTFNYHNLVDHFMDPHPGASELDVEAITLLKSNTHLKHLTLAKHHFGDAGAILIAEALTVNMSLKHLQLNGCDIGDRGCMALCKALQVNNTLESLDLVYNPFGEECTHAFVSALRMNRTLRTLGINKRFVAAKLLTSDTHLQHIYLISCDDALASFIAEGLKVNKSLKSLEIQHGEVIDRGYTALAQALLVNDTLEKLKIQFNAYVREYAMKELVSAIQINYTLQDFSLEYNPLQDAGACLMAEALTVNKSLKRLELYSCDIGDHGCKALAHALQVNSTLEWLALNGNKQGDAGVRAFIPTLRINRTLQHLEIRGLELPTKETTEELLQVVRRFLLPVWVNIRKLDIRFIPPIWPSDTRLGRAYLFNRDFDTKCRELRAGTISDDHTSSFRWFLPLLGSTHPFVKQITIFLLLRQRAEAAAQSLKLLLQKECIPLQPHELEQEPQECNVRLA